MTSRHRLTEAEVRALVARHRALVAGEPQREAKAEQRLPAGLRDLDVASVATALRRALDDAVARGAISVADRSVHMAYRGIGRPVRTAPALARDHGVTVTAIRSLVRRVERALSQAPIVVTPGVRASDGLADLHLALALDRATDGEDWEAFATVRRDRGAPRAAAPAGDAAMERHRRRRRARRLEGALAQRIVSSAPWRHGQPPSPPLDVEACAALLARHAADPLATRAEIRAALGRWRLLERDPFALPRDVAVAAWHVQQTVWREDEDIRARFAGTVVRALVPDPLLALSSLNDDAITLQAHGYGSLAEARCRTGLDRLNRLDLSAEQRAGWAATLHARLAVARPAEGTREDRRWREHALDRAFELLGDAGEGFQRANEPVFLRRRLDVAIGHHFASARGPGRPTKLVVDSDVAAVQDAIDGIGNAPNSLFWRITVMRWARGAGDVMSFERAAQEFTVLFSSFPGALRNQAWRYRELLSSLTGLSGAWTRAELPRDVLVHTRERRPPTEPSVALL